MSTPYYRCPRCGQLHPSDVRVCPHAAAGHGPPPLPSSSRIPAVRPSSAPPSGGPARQPARRDREATQEMVLPRTPAARPADAGETTTSVVSLGLLGMTVAGYQVRQVLGEGGMGVVYEAVRREDGMRVALKVLSERRAGDRSMLDRFRHEARVAGSLAHPHIVRFVGTGLLPDGTPYLALEYLEGETLGQRLARERYLPIEDALAVLRQVLSALGAAHDRGIVHRDLNPENVYLVNPPGAPPFVKLLDFGVAKMNARARSSDTQATLTQAGTVVGTVVYMAPEQAGGDRDVDARADLYSAGVLAYQMLLGRLPYKATQPVALLVEMNARVPPAPRAVRPAVPDWLEGAVLRLMSLEREKRFPSAREALRALGG